MTSSKRARQLERDRLRRQARRRSQRAARQRRYALLAAVVVVLMVLGTVIGLVASDSGGSGSNAAAAEVTPSASTASTGTPVCHYVEDAQTKTATSPGLPPDTKATGKHTMTIKLTQGTVVIALNDKAPCTVNSFIHLAAKKFFDNTPCPRVVTSGIYVLQCGDPTGTGSGGPGYTIPDENLTGATYPAGTLAMANTGAANTGGSQFFIVYQDSTSALTPSYTPFGTVVSGLDVIKKIAAAGSDNSNPAGGGKPKSPVTIESLTVS